MDMVTVMVMDMVTGLVEWIQEGRVGDPHERVHVAEEVGGHGGDGDGEDVRVEGGEGHDADVVVPLVVAPQQLGGHVVGICLEDGMHNVVNKTLQNLLPSTLYLCFNGVYCPQKNASTSKSYLDS